MWFEHDSSSRQSFTSPSRLSSSKRKTVSAIVNASESSEMIRDARMHRSPRSWKYSYTRLKKASRSEIASHRSSGPSPRISATGSISISISCSFWRRGAAVVWEDVIVLR